MHVPLFDRCGVKLYQHLVVRLSANFATMASSSTGYYTCYRIDLSKAEAEELVEFIEQADDFGISDDELQSSVQKLFSGALGWPNGQEIDITCLLHAGRHAIQYGIPLVYYGTNHVNGYDGDFSDLSPLSNYDNTGDSESEDTDSELTQFSTSSLIESSDDESLYAATLELDVETGSRLIRAPLGPEPLRPAFPLQDGGVGVFDIGPEPLRPACVVCVDETVVLGSAPKRRVLKAKRTMHCAAPHSGIGFRWSGNFVRFDLFINEMMKEAPEDVLTCMGAFFTPREWQWSMRVCKQWRSMLLPADVHYSTAGVMDVKAKAQLHEIVPCFSIPSLVTRNMTISLCDRIWIFGNTSAAYNLAATCRDHYRLMYKHARSMVVLCLREIEGRLDDAMEEFTGLALGQLDNADLDHIFFFEMYPQAMFRMRHPIFVLR